MSRRELKKQQYRKALWAGLAISVGFHALLLALARFDGEATVAQRELALADVVAPEEVEAERGSEGAAAAEAAPGEPGSQVSPAILAVMALDETAFILARATALHMAEPIVPRPALEPNAVESGFTPIIVEEETQTASATATEGIGNIATRGGGIYIGVGGDDHCAPGHGTNTILINRRLPVAGTFQRTGTGTRLAAPATFRVRATTLRGVRRR